MQSDQREALRRDLPDTCDRCGAPQARLLPIVYGRMAGVSVGFHDDFYYAGCLVTDATWVCRVCGDREGIVRRC